MLKANSDILTTPEKLKQNSLMTIQGYTFTSEQTRDTILLKFYQLRNSNPVSQSCNQKKINTKFLDFKAFYSLPNAAIYHFQLHEVLKIVGAGELAFLTRQGLKAVNLSTCKSKEIFPLANILSFDCSTKLGLISGVFQKSFNKYQTFLFDLKTTKFVFKSGPYKIPNIIGKMTFIDFNGSKMFASGNANFGSLIDLSANFSETEIPSDFYINNHDYNKKDQVMGFALENGKIQITSLKAPTLKDSLLFKAHEGYLLGFKHLSADYWVSGGEDFAINLWDVRKANEPAQSIFGLSFIPSAFEFLKEKEILFCLEMYCNLSAFQFKHGTICQEVVSTLADCGGIVFNRQTEEVFASLISPVSPEFSGIARFKVR